MTGRKWPLLLSLWLAIIGLGLAVYAASAYPTASVSGQVIRLDGQPAGGAWVRVQTTDNLTYADVDGLFTTNWGRSGTDQVEMYQIVVPVEALAHIYYVAPNGNDANPGTLAQPWRTIQHAADTLTAGDTVYIRAGTYPERVIPQHSGSAGQPITYAAYPGETVTLDGTGITLPDDLAGLFEIAGRSYIQVSGLHVINAGPHADNAGILVSDSSHITVENCATFSTASSGIGVWGSQQVIIEGNRVEQAGLGGGQECITIAGTSNFEVRDNTVLDCQKERGVVVTW